MYHLPIRQPQYSYEVRRQARAHIVAQLALELRQRRIVVHQDDLLQVYELRVRILAWVAC